MKTQRIIIVAVVYLGLMMACSLFTETQVVKSNPFIGNWMQARLSDHPLGMGICGNYQKIEFLENGTFILTNDFSGVYEPFDPGNPFPSSRSLEGTYTILNKDQIELVFKIDGISETWNYVFADDELTMSFSAPSDFGGGYIPCYFTEADN
jgi:hypothetical protein